MLEIITQQPSLLLLIGSVIFGILLIISMIILMIVKHPMPPEVLQAVRVLIAIGAGFASAGFLGSFQLGGDWKGLAITASGGFAAFLIVYLVGPGAIRQLFTPPAAKAVTPQNGE